MSRGNTTPAASRASDGARPRRTLAQERLSRRQRRSCRCRPHVAPLLDSRDEFLGGRQSHGHDFLHRALAHRRAGVLGAGRAAPPRAARALLPDARVVRGRRGRGAGDVPARVAARETFEGRSTFRAWLYRIATNACLDLLAQRRRPSVTADGDRGFEVPWLQPYPDRLLDEPPRRERAGGRRRRAGDDRAGVPRRGPAPCRRGRGRVLILRDVLGWPADDIADAARTTPSTR